jgi:septal ring factor EnvC (AmiA/AmiB activator)
MSVEDFMHVSVVEQLNKGIPALLRIDKKQDKIVEETAKLDENREAIIDEISEQKDTLDDRLKRIESDISKIKAKVGI